MDTSLSIEHYLEELSSSAPTPGGGNVSAFCGTLATSLGVMVCNLTLGKKKYINSEEELKVIKEGLIKAKAEFLNLSIEDNKAFNKVMDAYKLPKEGDEQRSLRTQKIEETTIGAGIIPFQVITLCKSIIPSIIILAEKGNQNSLSDTGVAFSLISTAAQGAYLNVLINLNAYTNNSNVNDILEKARTEFREVKEKCSEGIDLIEKKLSDVVS